MSKPETSSVIVLLKWDKTFKEGHESGTQTDQIKRTPSIKLDFNRSKRYKSRYKTINYKM